MMYSPDRNAVDQIGSLARLRVAQRAQRFVRPLPRGISDPLCRDEFCEFVSRPEASSFKATVDRAQPALTSTVG